MQVTPTLERVAQAVPEGRLEHGLSQRRLAALSGVSAATIRKLERGGQIDSALLIRLAATLVVLDAYRPPSRDNSSEVSFESLFDPTRYVLPLTEEWEAVA